MTPIVVKYVGKYMNSQIYEMKKIERKKLHTQKAIKLDTRN